MRQIEANTPDSVKAAYEAIEAGCAEQESILHSLEKQDLSAQIDGVVLKGILRKYHRVPGAILCDRKC